MPDVIPTEVAACEACGNEAGPRCTIHWHPQLRAALCFLCRDTPPPTWARNQLQRITITIATNRAQRPPENTMRSILTILILVLFCAGCAHDSRAVDTWLRDANAMPDDKAPSPYMPADNRRRATGASILDIFPTTPKTVARAEALQYAKLWVKFAGAVPVPFGYDPQTDAGVLALAEAQRAADAR